MVTPHPLHISGFGWIDSTRQLGGCTKPGTISRFLTLLQERITILNMEGLDLFLNFCNNIPIFEFPKFFQFVRARDAHE